MKKKYNNIIDAMRSTYSSDTILDNLTCALEGANAFHDTEAATRISRAIAAFTAPVEINIFSEEMYNSMFNMIDQAIDEMSDEELERISRVGDMINGLKDILEEEDGGDDGCE